MNIVIFAHNLGNWLIHLLMQTCWCTFLTSPCY